MTFRKLTNSDTHNCFACSPKNTHGLHMELYTDDQSVRSQITLPAHFSGWGQVVHGGILSTLLDEIMGWTGLYLLRQITLTQQLTVDFIKSAYVGESLEVVGRIVGTHGKRNAQLEGVITRDNGEVCARAKGDFKTLSPKLAIRLGIMTEVQRKTFFDPLFEPTQADHD
jgi:uncharacterized protein (TIGR00369 family)